MIVDSNLGARPSTPVMKSGRPLPVIEIFGPTLQGEGRLSGIPCTFVRFGGCDYRCSWCDTPHAVLPEQVRQNAVSLTPAQILGKTSQLGGSSEWTILSGGNPAILNLGVLVELFHERGRRLAVETQGSRWKSWLSDVDLLTLSPKPPSSGMVTDLDTLEDIIVRRISVQADDLKAVVSPRRQLDIKIVIFDQADRDYVLDLEQRLFDRLGLHDPFYDVRFFLSQGTNVGVSTRDDLLDAAVDLWESVKYHPQLGRWSVAVQQHVLYWGHVKGV